jgi:hypothetical protein
MQKSNIEMQNDKSKFKEKQMTFAFLSVILTFDF